MSTPIPEDFERTEDENTLFVDHVEGCLGISIVEMVDNDGITTEQENNVPTLICHGRLSGHKQERQAMFILAFSDHGWVDLLLQMAKITLEQNELNESEVK